MDVKRILWPTDFSSIAEKALPHVKSLTSTYGAEVHVLYVIEDGALKLRIDETLPFRPDKSTPCVSCVQTSDHRFGATTNEYQILDKFAQK